MENSSITVLIWWGGMTCIAILNLVFLYFTRRTLQKQLPQMSSVMQFIRAWQLRLASIYVIGCGFRSVLPRGDIRRIVLVDHWISAVAIGRTVATVAELAFVAQWAFILYEIGKSTNNKWCRTVSKIVVPLIVVAECFSWYACTTTNYFGTIIEESLWAIAAAITVVGFVKTKPLYSGLQRKFLSAGILSGVLYVIYMVTVDVPTYIRGWLANKTVGKTYASVKEGLMEVATQWTYTRTHTDWQYEMVWMTLYFSVAVWMSLFIVNSPQLDKNIIQNE